MEKLYALFTYRGENLKGYIDGYTIYGEDDYAMVFVPDKSKIYSIQTEDLIVLGYREVVKETKITTHNENNIDTKTN